MQTIYGRVDDPYAEYLKKLSAESRLSISKTLDGLIADAMLRGVTADRIAVAAVEQRRAVAGAEPKAGSE